MATKTRHSHMGDLVRSTSHLLAAGVFVTSLAGLPAPAVGQTTGQGYVYGGYGAGLCVGCEAEGIVHLGGGGELILAERVSIGADVGFIAPPEAFSAGVGLASFNAAYRFGGRAARTRPFLTGGYSLIFREGHVNALNLGAGLDRWMSNRLGLRMEVRDHIPIYDEGSFEAHYLDFRVGLIFR